LNVAEKYLLLNHVVKIEESRPRVVAQDLKISLELLKLVEYVVVNIGLTRLGFLEHNREESLADRGGN